MGLKEYLGPVSKNLNWGVCMIHKFLKPFEFEGQTYESIEFDLESLKGSDISAAKKSFNARGGYSPIPATDSDFCALLLERLTKKPLDFFEALPANEYCSLTQKVSNFLLTSA